MGQSQTIIPVVVACINCQDQILLLRRDKEPFARQWSLPGGKMEAGEFPHQAVRRELLEETGLEINELDCLGLVCEIITEREKTDNILYHHLVYVFAGSTGSMESYTCPEGELRWFPRKNILAMGEALVATDWRIIDNLLLNGRRGVYNSTVRFADNDYQCVEFSPINLNRHRNVNQTVPGRL